MNKRGGAPTIVTIHGGSHGAWCWRQLSAALAARDLALLCPDLPESGEDMTPVTDVSWGAYVECVIAAIDEAPRPVLLIGHSLAGALISQAAEHRANKVCGLFYIAALAPLDGEAVGQTPRSPERYALTGRESTVARALRPSRAAGVYKLDPVAAIDIFYNDCRAEIALEAVSRLRPLAMAPVEGVLRLTPDRWGRIPKTYVICLRDQALPAPTQRGLAARISARANRASVGSLVLPLRPGGPG